MGRELVLAARHDLRPDLVIPLPLSKERLRERGFNQSAEIAREVARDFDLDLDHDACVRARHTIPQVGLTLDRRRANMRNAFQCRRSLVGAKVAVVDDVMTTGATLDEVARTLKESGAARVTGWVVARTPESRR